MSVWITDHHLEHLLHVTCSIEKIEDIFKELPSVFTIADYILIVHFDISGVDHDRTLHRVLQMHRKEILKFIKDNTCFRCTSVPFLSKIISRQDMRPDLRKLKALAKHATPKVKEGIASIPLNSKQLKNKDEF